MAKKWKKNKWVGIETIEGINEYIDMNRKPIKVKVKKGWEYIWR